MVRREKATKSPLFSPDLECKLPQTKKMAPGCMQEPPQKCRYNKGQLEAFFNPGTRVTAPDNKTGRPVQTKKPAKMSKRFNKKARLDDEHSEGVT